MYTDSLGFKDSGVKQIPLTTKKRRILFIGDSFVEGVGLPYEDTFTGIIQKELGDDKYDILNAAVTSYSPKIYYLKIKYLIENTGLRFEELNVFIDHSDIEDELVYKDFAPRENRLSASMVYLSNFLYRHSVVFHLARKQYYIKSNRLWYGLARIPPIWRNTKEFRDERELWSTDQAVFEKWGQQGLRLAAENMDKLYELCKKHGIKMTVVVYPWPQLINAEGINSKQALFWGDFCKARGINFINYFPDFINDLPFDKTGHHYFIAGDVHWDKSGHRFIAQKWLSLYRKQNLQEAGDGSGVYKNSIR